MKKIFLLAAFAAHAMATTFAAEAKTFGPKEQCFQVGKTETGGWNRTLKIKAQNKFSDNPNAVTPVVALEHGTKATNPPLDYYNDLTGSANYSKSRELVQIGLVGTGDSLTRGEVGKAGIFVVDYNLLMRPFGSDKLGSGAMMGVVEYYDSSYVPVDSTERFFGLELLNIPCKDF